jgi:peptidoglycan/LPS O-acetylase OafA/YrhL
MKGRTRVSSLDGLRGIAAIAIMMFHFNIFFLPQAGLSRIIPAVGRAYLAVDLFFLLSGFVMAHVYGRAMAANIRANWLEFAKARFVRIYPLFVLTTLTMVIVVAVDRTALGFLGLSGISLAAQALLLQNWGSGMNWNYPSWSLSTEACCYLFFIFSAGLLLTGRHPRITAICCGAILAVLSIANHGSLNFYHGVPGLLRALSEFSLGALLFRAHSSGAGFPRNWLAPLVAIAACFGVLLLEDFLIVMALGCFLFFCVGATGVAVRLLNSRPAVALGNWSYSIYLWHAPTHCAVMVAFAVNRHPVSELDLSTSRLLLLATILVVVALSGVSYNYFEVPMRRWLRRPLSVIRL